MKHLLRFLMAAAALLSPLSAQTPDPFAVVLIDEASEKQLGGFPIPREILAAGITKIAEQKPRAIILKFFIDLPKSREADAALAHAISQAPVILQARIDPSEANPNPFPPKFFLTDIPASWSISMVGDSGWIPLPSLSQHALDIGFADHISPTAAPLLERYQGKAVKSLYLIGLEQAFDAPADITKQSITIDDHSLKLGPSMLAPIKFDEPEQLDYTPFMDLATAQVPADAFTDKVVILGYDGVKMHSFTTPVGELRAHRFFCYVMFALYQQMLPAETTLGVIQPEEAR